MSAQRQPTNDASGQGPHQDDQWVPVPTVVNADGDRVVTIHDDKGQPQTWLIAELVLEAFKGPRPPGHIVRFKDGNRMNCEAGNLEWSPGPASRDEAARARAIATRQRADAMRRSLEGRAHSDSALLVAEDRLR